MNTNTYEVKQIDDLDAARSGSYYTIRGAGGDLSDYARHVAEFLVGQQVGDPTSWWTTSGAHVNEYARRVHGAEIHPDDLFPADLTFLMFPLDGLDVGRLAVQRVVLRDVWFDDMIANMRRGR